MHLFLDHERFQQVWAQQEFHPSPILIEQYLNDNDLDLRGINQDIPKTVVADDAPLGQN